MPRTASVPLAPVSTPPPATAPGASPPGAPPQGWTSPLTAVLPLELLGEQLPPIEELPALAPLGSLSHLAREVPGVTGEPAPPRLEAVSGTLMTDAAAAAGPLLAVAADSAAARAHRQRSFEFDETRTDMAAPGLEPTRPPRETARGWASSGEVEPDRRPTERHVPVGSRPEDDAGEAPASAAEDPEETQVLSPPPGERSR